ncbi:MAG: cupin domain-containing protein [Succinivibrionaceae bacterium]|nr:cupin domain-containing protein [Succinivibrionaceae bacterium]
MTNVKTTEIGSLDKIGSAYEHGKAFLHDALELTSCEISVNFMPSGSSSPFKHKHKQNEEVYIVLKGAGSMTVDNETFAISEGSCVRVKPEGVRSMTADTDLQYICVQAKDNSLEQFVFGDGEIC